MKSNKILKFLCAATLSTSALLSIASDPVKVAFVYVGPTGDAGWTYTHDEGRKFLESQLGDKVETTFIENVPEGADAERVIRQLAQKGNDLIFTTSFGYMNPTLKIAKMFPDVKFEHASGYKQSVNSGSYFSRPYQARYLTGYIAGSMTETNVLGYVASFPIPEVIRGINAFTKGAQEANPDITVKVVWASTWYDPAKELEAAEALILQNADVLTQHTDSPAVVKAAQSKGIYAIGYHSDMSAFGSDAHLSAAVHDWGSFYVNKTQQVIDGTWKSEDLWHGIAQGVTDISPINPIVPKEVQDIVNAKKAAIADGTLQVFSGPIYNQAGEMIISESETMSDDQLKGFDWYIKGIEGKLPN